MSIPKLNNGIVLREISYSLEKMLPFNFDTDHKLGIPVDIWKIPWGTGIKRSKEIWRARKNCYWWFGKEKLPLPNYNKIRKIFKK